MKSMLRHNNKASFLQKYADKYLMMAPFMLLFILFTVIPVVMSIVLGFTNFNLLEFPRFVGWNNYIKLFLGDKIFIKCAKNTLVFAIVTGPLSYFLSLLMAWFINELSRKSRTLMTFLFYAPSISSNLFIIWSFIFSSDMYGWVNGTLMRLGFIDTPIAWLTNPSYTIFIVIMIQLWMSMGAGFLSFIAGLQGVDKSLYESAALDGVRNRWQELFYVTLPSMGPQLLFGAVMQISASLSAGSICTALAGSPSTDYSVDTIITLITDYSTVRYEMGYASAMATVLFIVMILTNKFIGNILRNYMD